ncbi:MAG: MFS transporter [Gammaproteobacteria bacterium]
MTSAIESSARWRVLAAIIASISVVGLAAGLTGPLVSLNLDYRGVDSTLIGVIAGAPALGVLLFSPYVPGLVARLGARATLQLAIGVGAGSIVALPFLPLYWQWLPPRILTGMAIGTLFTVSETWINQIAEEHNRGKMVGVYATVFSLCFAVGPLLIVTTGARGVLPFAVSCAILIGAALPLFWARAELPAVADKPSFGVLGFMRNAAELCAAVMLFAFIDTASLSLLPLFALRHGYDEATGALMASVAIAGNIALQIPIGWLADRMSRRRLLLILGWLVLICAASLPFVIYDAWLLWPVLLVLGAAVGGVYTLALIIVGQRYTGIELVTANAAFGVLWGVGSLIGPLLSGAGMRLLNPDGLAVVWALAGALFVGLFVHTRRLHQS